MNIGCLYLDIYLELDEKIHRSFVNLFLSDIACMDCVGYMVTSQDWSAPLLIAQMKKGVILFQCVYLLLKSMPSLDSAILCAHM